MRGVGRTDSGVGWLFVGSVFPKKSWDGLARPRGRDASGREQPGGRAAANSPLGNRGAQTALPLSARFWVIPGSEGLSRGAGAQRAGWEQTHRSWARRWKPTPAAGFPCPAVPRSRGSCLAFHPALVNAATASLTWGPFIWRIWWLSAAGPPSLPPSRSL